jgi:hypothetical protein
VIARAGRGVACAIAVLALIDPALTMNRNLRPRIAVVVEGGPSMALPGGGAATRAEAARRARAALERGLSSDFEIVDGLDSSAAAAVVIGDRYPDGAIAGAMNVSTVAVRGRLAPNVRIARIDVPQRLPAATTIRVLADVEAVGMSGRSTTVTVRAMGTEVARASHAWSSDREVWNAALDAVPVGVFPLAVKITAVPLPGEATEADNHAAARVEAAPPMRVLVLEARPSWASAFARRALEDDPRFAVSGISQPAPRAVVRSGSGPGDPWDTFDVVVAGGLEALKPEQTARLDRFARERGGAVVLVPDARMPAGLAREWMGGSISRETLLERAATLEGGGPPLAASEVLTADDLPWDAEVLYRLEGRPVVWSVARGDGRVLVSGAMDAWRRLGDAGAGFDRFWRSTIAGLALGARRPLSVEWRPDRAAVGDRIDVAVQVRALERAGSGERLAVAARAGEMPIRLWPDVRAGRFVGSFTMPPGRGPSVLSASMAGGATESATIAADDSPREAAAAPIELLGTSRGGVNVAAEDLAPLVGHLRRTVPHRRAPATIQPMRSAWWLAPFCAGLCGEWWWRRRSGMR